ncbi:zinc finger protein 850-like [Musca domestica]|uniref:Zinc finger protein 850-like n=1 Tax=Musca domestica TaxID=7370 RepID=A0ABM3V508_MUSDO|nr:zinc finger protein 850-like [Musca domestica]
MSLLNACRLCKNICDNSICLFDELGSFTEPYHTTIKFFPPSFLEIEDNEPDPLAVLCEECWHHIFTFNNFQKNVIIAKEQYLQNLAKECTISDKQLVASVISIDDNPEPLNEVEGCNAGAALKDTQIRPSLDARSDTISIAGTLKDSSDEEDQDQQASREVPNYDWQNSFSSWSETELLANVQSRIRQTESCDIPTTSAHSLEGNRPKKKRANEKELDDIICQWMPSLECHICKEIFKTFSVLSNHVAQIHPKEKISVECCGRAFHFRCRLAAHCQIHIDPKHYQCEKCGQCFTTENRMMNHMRVVQCDNGRTRRTKLMLSQQREGNYSQTASSKDGSIIVLDEDSSDLQSIKSKEEGGNSVLNTPENEPEKEEIYEEFEETKFVMQSSIPIVPELGRKNHRTSDELDAIISQWKPILACRICGEKCPTFTLLSHHFSKHHPDTKMFVECCGHRYRFRCQLVDHAHAHLNPELFQCFKCNSSFSTKQAQQYHTKYVECLKGNVRKKASTKRYKRGKTKKFADLMITHRSLNQSNVHVCRSCKKSFKHRSSLVRHITMSSPCRAQCPSGGQTHPHQEIDDAEEKDEKYTNRRGGKAKTHICRSCKARFQHRSSLVRHITMNSACQAGNIGLRRIDRKCFICSKQFKFRSRMLHHMKVIHGHCKTEKPDN